MSRKRRMFDIEMPEEGVPDAAPADRAEAPPADRRGPMASAVRENAESLRARADAERAIREENDALAHEFVRARGQGLVMSRIDLGRIRADKLTRDRRDIDQDGLRELMDSIRDLGLSNPIQVEEAEDGFELIQGLRRLTAFRALHAETGDAAYAAIPALVRPRGEALERLYRRMVDENLIRTDISFAEMAALARSYAQDPGTACADVDAAVQVLYGSAGKQKRSYIRAFAKLLAALDGDLRHAEAIPRALGLAVRKRMEAEPDSLADLRRMLAARPGRNADDELAILRSYGGEAGEAEPAPEPEQGFPAGNGGPSAARPPRKARTTFEVRSPLGEAKCTASQGRLELRADTDFTAIDRRRLEAALAAFLREIS